VVVRTKKYSGFEPWHVDKEALFVEDLCECLLDPWVMVLVWPEFDAGGRNRSRADGRTKARVVAGAGIEGCMVAKRDAWGRRRQNLSGNRELFDLQRISETELVVPFRCHEIHELYGIARHGAGRQGEDGVGAFDTHGLLAANLVTALQNNHIAGSMSCHDRDQKNSRQ
jgi:hypothetical protein